MASDRELLRAYVTAHDESAFAEIVNRHSRLVYATAVRRVGGDTHLAQGVAQSVFIDLARRASQLPAQVVVGGWLYTSTVFAAAKAVRTMQRRRRRDEEACAMNERDAELTAADWEKLRPVIDDALGGLPPRDREAILLRFFLNRTCGEIGAELALKEDTARVRVQRGLEKLRSGLRRRGITSTAEALGLALTAHMANARPAIPAPVMANVALAAARAVPLAATSLSFVCMTSSRILGSVAVVALAAVVYLGLLASRENDARRAAELVQVRSAQEHATYLKTRDELQALRGRLTAIEVDRKRAGAEAAETAHLETELDRWLGKVDRLKRFCSAHPQWLIPEMQLLTATDWLEATKEAVLDTEADYRKALSELRRMSKYKVTSRIGEAMKRYLAANGGVLPENGQQLVPYVSEPVDAATLGRFTVNPSGKMKGLSTIGGGGPQFVLWEATPVDPLWDSAVFLSERGDSGVRTTQDTDAEKTAETAIKKYTDATGVAPQNADQLAPYLTAEMKRQRVNEYLAARFSAPPLAEKNLGGDK